jgi:hypothetical protein
VIATIDPLLQARMKGGGQSPFAVADRFFCL